MPRPTLSEEARPHISIISWVNKPDVWNGILLQTVSPLYGYLWGPPVVDFVTITPQDGARNIGEAYEMGRKAARFPIKAYLHQDMSINDMSWAIKLDLIFSAPHSRVGALGFIGSRRDTGAAWFHTAEEDHVGGIPSHDFNGANYSLPTFEEVAVVDGFGFISNMDIPWATCYEGPHMAIEDYCMRVREAGRIVCTMDSMTSHASPGTVDESYWRSVETFRRIWAHRLPADLLPIEQMRERSEMHLRDLAATKALRERFAAEEEQRSARAVEWGWA